MPTSCLRLDDSVTHGIAHQFTHGISEGEVLNEAAEHAKTAHDMHNIPPDVLSKARSAIRDEGRTGTKKAGA